MGGGAGVRDGDLGAVLADVGAADVAGGVIVRRRGVGDVAWDARQRKAAPPAPLNRRRPHRRRSADCESYAIALHRTNRQTECGLVEFFLSTSICDREGDVVDGL